MEARKLGVMVADLRVMKNKLVPDFGDEDQPSEEEMKKLDKFQRRKRELVLVLKKTRDECTKLREFRKKLGEDSRDKEIIRLMSDNSALLKSANEIWQDLKTILAEDLRNPKRMKALGDKECSLRHKTIQLLGQEVVDLTHMNSRVKDNSSAFVSELGHEDGAKVAPSTPSSQDDKRQARNERVAKRKANRTKNGAIELDDTDLRDVTPASAQEQKFMDQVTAGQVEQNLMLDEIGKGLEELTHLAIDMNKSLDLQSGMIAEIDSEMDETIARFKTANGKLKHILDDQGGMTRWCPMIVCCCVLLALLGYLFHMF